MKQTTWSNIGKETKGTDVETVLKEAGLDYTVVKEPVFLQNGKTFFKVPDQFVTRIEGSEGNKGIFGIVGKDYEIIQNRPAFEFINNLTKHGLTFERAGMTHWGMIYIIASLPEYKIFGDSVKTYLIFQTSHDGGITLKAAICPLRIACTNQFAVAFKQAKNVISIRHTKNASMRIEEAKQVLREALGYSNEFKALAKELQAVRIPEAKEQEILELMYPISEKDGDAKVERMMDKRLAIHNYFHDAEDLQNFRGTGWGLFNAFADEFTHKEPARKTEHWEESRFWQSMQTADMDKFIRLIKAA